MDHVSLNRQRGAKREKKKTGRSFRNVLEKKKNKKKKNANEITDDRSYNTFE